MINLKLEQEIKNYVNIKKNGINWNKLPEDYKNYLLQRFINCNNAKEAFYRIILNYETIPICPICNKHHLAFTGIKAMPFKKTCGNKLCENDMRKQSVAKTNIERYGKPGHTNSEKIKQTKLKRYGDPYYSNHEKSKQTCLERYGVESPMKTEKVKEKLKQTCLERYGVENGGGSKQALEKIKQTNLDRYGVSSSFSRKEVIEKSKNTKMIRYGNEHFTNHEKAVKTSLERYGVENPFQIKEIRDKWSKTILKKYGVDHNWKIPSEHDKTHTAEALEKKKQTSLKHYGVEHPSQSEDIKELKRYTFFINSYKRETGDTEEGRIYKMIKNIYPNTLTQYGIDKRYPHKCDFYIPELDMFIEYNAFPTHGGHPYEGTPEDLKLIEWLKNWEHGHRDYKTFSERDPQKRKDVKDNNLNFVELWNFKEAVNFINKLQQEKGDS